MRANFARLRLHDFWISHIRRFDPPTQNGISRPILSMPRTPSPTAPNYWLAGVAASGAMHVTVVLVVHLMLDGAWLRVIPPPRGTVSIDLRAAWASSGSGMDGSSQRAVAFRLFPEQQVEDAPNDLTARALPVVPLGELPPVDARDSMAEAPEAAREVSVDLRRRMDVEQPMKQPEAQEPPAFPRSRRATRAGLDLAAHRETQAWTPPSMSARRTDGTQTDAEPAKVFSPQPRYPPGLLAARITGTVKLLVRVNRDGRVTRASVHRSSGRAALDQSALEAVRRWRFEPARRAGIAVRLDVIVPIRFSIQD